MNIREKHVTKELIPRIIAESIFLIRAISGVYQSKSKATKLEIIDLAGMPVILREKYVYGIYFIKGTNGTGEGHSEVNYQTIIKKYFYTDATFCSLLLSSKSYDPFNPKLRIHESTKKNYSDKRRSGGFLLTMISPKPYLRFSP